MRYAAWLVGQTQRDQGGREVLVQLADETVAAPGLAGREVLSLFVIDVSSGAGRWRQYAAVPVRSFDGCAVENKDDQQQAEPTREIFALVFKSSEHAGP